MRCVHCGLSITSIRGALGVVWLADGLAICEYGGAFLHAPDVPPLDDPHALDEWLDS